jgi:hypothetical protein
MWLEGYFPDKATKAASAEAPTEAPEEELSPWRRIAIVLLVVFGCLVIALGSFYAWAVRTILTTDAWVAATAPLAEDPAVQQAVGTFIVQRLDETVDVKSTIEAQLPAQLDPIAGPIAAGVDQIVTDVVVDFMASDAFGGAWETAMRDGHAAIVTIIRDTNINSTIPFQIDAVVAKIDERLGQRGIDLFPQGPPSLGDTAIQLDQRVAQARAAIGYAERIHWLTPILAFSAFALALYLARRRGRLFVAIALSVAFTLLLELIAFNVIQTELVDMAYPEVYSAGLDAALSILTAGLYEQTWLLIIVAVLIAGVGWLIERATDLEPARQFVVQYGRALEVAAVGAGLAYLVLVPDATISRLVFVIVLVSAAIIGVESLRASSTEGVESEPAGGSGPVGTEEAETAR